MSKLEQLTAPPIDAVYSLASPTEAISLDDVEVEFDHRGTTHSELAKVDMQFSPKRQLVITIPRFQRSIQEAMKDLVLGDMWSGKLKLVGRGVVIDAFCTSVGDSGMVITPNQSGFIATVPSANIRSATLNLVNFPNVRGPDNFILLSGEPPLQAAESCGRVILEADGWKITIAAIKETKERLSTLKTEGGYVISHVAGVRRCDGSTFSSEELAELLTCLSESTQDSSLLRRH